MLLRLLVRRHHRRAAGPDVGRIEVRRRLGDRVEHVRPRHDEQVDVLAGLLRDRRHAAEEQLLVAREQLVVG